MFLDIIPVFLDFRDGVGLFPGEYMGMAPDEFGGNLAENFIQEERFLFFRAAADELGDEYSFLVEKLISDYEHFRAAPEQEKLNQIFTDIKGLQILLV